MVYDKTSEGHRALVAVIKDIGYLEWDTDSLAQMLVEGLKARGWLIIWAPVCVECGNNIRPDYGVTIYRTGDDQPIHGMCLDKRNRRSE